MYLALNTIWAIHTKPLKSIQVNLMKINFGKSASLQLAILVLQNFKEAMIKDLS